MYKMTEDGVDRNEALSGGDKLVPLLEERNKTRVMIEKIDSRRGEFQDDVLERVRSDYAIRLENINREIARQARNFQNTLADYRELVGLLERSDNLAERSLEELKVRRDLGEMDKSEFDELTRNKRDKVKLYRQKLESYRVNMQRLENVLNQLEE
jgi:septal ring factor EnvC (AmiA/AmiB activator)